MQMQVQVQMQIQIQIRWSQWSLLWCMKGCELGEHLYSLREACCAHDYWLPAVVCLLLSHTSKSLLLLLVLFVNYLVIPMVLCRAFNPQNPCPGQTSDFSPSTTPSFFLLEMSYPLGVDLHPDQPCMKQYCNFRPFLKKISMGKGVWILQPAQRHV